MTENKWEYNGAMYSQLELIDMIIERLEFCLSGKTDYDIPGEEQNAYVAEIEKIWAVICHGMWW